MKGSRSIKEEYSEVGFASVKIRIGTFNKLKKHKDETNVPMAAFIDDAVKEKFKKLRKNY